MKEGGIENLSGGSRDGEPLKDKVGGDADSGRRDFLRMLLRGGVAAVGTGLVFSRFSKQGVAQEVSGNAEAAPKIDRQLAAEAERMIYEGFSGLDGLLKSVNMLLDDISQLLEDIRKTGVVEDVAKVFLNTSDGRVLSSVFGFEVLGKDPIGGHLFTFDPINMEGIKKELKDMYEQLIDEHKRGSDEALLTALAIRERYNELLRLYYALNEAARKAGVIRYASQQR